MATKVKKKNKEEILDIYMEYVLSQGIDVSVEDLCADTKLDKYNFYDYFDSIPHIERSVWAVSYTHLTLPTIYSV